MEDVPADLITIAGPARYPCDCDLSMLSLIVRLYAPFKFEAPTS